MNKKFIFTLIFIFLFKTIFSNTFDFSIKKPITTVRTDFSYSIVNNMKYSGFYSSSKISVDFDAVKFDCGYQLVNQTSDFTIQTSYGPRILDQMKLQVSLTYNHLDSKNFTENNFLFGLKFSTKPKKIFKFTVYTAYLLKTAIIGTTNYVISNNSLEAALYFDWTISKYFETFFHIETASFYNHILFYSMIYSTGIKITPIKNFSFGSTISATYIDFFASPPYHSEVSVSSFIEFIIF